ncbi:glycosyltransferase [Polaribacter undariae]|uniref:Glycosyltransferase n=2 Tax=Polaribacter sejongensis TaxID=985043 RepID=A0AAJ1VG74_9FLAO|nr:glycosyltransferase [Polaribacter undariae]MDN3618944.1 glycosyltransferase [Polaribacter undariae]UWD33820.1 glycosyltransferase [Polaribacter undariae]
MKIFFNLLKSFIRKLLFYKIHFFNCFLNKTTSEQLKKPKSIPIIIINYNQLFYLKKLIKFLLKHEYENIIIIDNKSNYKPLLKYYEEIRSKVSIIRMDYNWGHRVFWEVEALNKEYGKGYYVITDADIIPSSECPEDFLKTFLDVLQNDKKLAKVGFSLKIDDLSNENPNKDKVILWESKFWKKQYRNIGFDADIDTTFALYRPFNEFKFRNFYKAVRLDNPYIASHGGWYLDPKNLTEEQTHYMRTANNSSSWKIDELGEINKDIYNR